MWPATLCLVLLLAGTARPQALNIPGVLDTVSMNAANFVANDLIAQANLQMIAQQNVNTLFGRPSGPLAPIQNFNIGPAIPPSPAAPSPTFSSLFSPMFAAAPAPFFSAPAPASSSFPTFSAFPSAAGGRSPSRSLPPLLSPSALSARFAQTNDIARRTAALMEGVNQNTISAVAQAAAARGLSSVAAQLSGQTDFDQGLAGSRLQSRCLEDGLFYLDTHSYLVCVHGNGHVQACPPGTRNYPEVRLLTERAYSYNDFCTMNMVDHGYNVASARKNVSYHANKYAVRPEVAPAPAPAPAPPPAAPYRYHEDHGYKSSAYKTVAKHAPDGAVYYYHYYQ